MIRIYGVIDKNGLFTKISGSEISAKKYATINDFTKVGYSIGDIVKQTHIKINGKWQKSNL